MIENPDGVGEVGSLACGDALKLTFKPVGDVPHIKKRFRHTAPEFAVFVVMKR